MDYEPWSNTAGTDGSWHKLLSPSFNLDDWFKTFFYVEFKKKKEKRLSQSCSHAYGI